MSKGGQEEEGFIGVEGGYHNQTRYFDQAQQAPRSIPPTVLNYQLQCQMLKQQNLIAELVGTVKELQQQQHAAPQAPPHYQFYPQQPPPLIQQQQRARSRSPRRVRSPSRRSHSPRHARKRSRSRSCSKRDRSHSRSKRDRPRSRSKRDRPRSRSMRSPSPRRRKRERDHQGKNLSHYLFLASMPEDITWEKILTTLKRYSRTRVKSIYMSRSDATTCRGHGFAKFSNRRDRDACLGDRERIWSEAHISVRAIDLSKVPADVRLKLSK